MHKIVKQLEQFLDNKWVMGVLTVALFAHMIATPWMPLSYLAGFSSLAARIVISVLVLLLVCVHPYYGILLTSVLVVALNEYTNRSATFQNVLPGSPLNANISELDRIYNAPLHEMKMYDKNFQLQNAPENISQGAETILGQVEQDVNMLVNQHSMQTTSVVGGLHGIFNQTEEQKVDYMIKTHPASNTLTDNVRQNFVGTVPYITDQDLIDAQSNIVCGVDPDAPTSNFPELGNKELLDAQGLSAHFPKGNDQAATPGSKF
jgi:hypothetical protein